MIILPSFKVHKEERNIHMNCVVDILTKEVILIGFENSNFFPKCEKIKGSLI